MPNKKTDDTHRSSCYIAAKIGHPKQFPQGEYPFSLSSLAVPVKVSRFSLLIRLLPHKAVTPHGEIRCNKMIIATHFPLLNKHGGYFLKLYQHRSYVLALEGAPPMDGMYVDEANTGLSLRRYGNRLLLGGGGHRTGKKGGCWQELERFVTQYYPRAEVVGRWPHKTV